MLKLHRIGFVAIFLVLALLIAATSGCSINQIAVNALADTLAGDGEGGASVFTSDDDPELVGDALPFALKLYETILQEAPDHQGLLLATGSGFISYANAFVATPASMLPFEEWELQQSEQARAKKLYLRGRDYLIHAMDIRYPGFAQVIMRSSPDAADELREFLKQTAVEDVPYLYWIGAGWVAAFALDAFDLEIAFTVPRAQVLMLRALELDETYSDGAIHDFLVQYYASLPESMGGDKEKAEYHHKRALEIADGRLAGPYLSYAEAVLIQRQDVDQFVSMMEAALAVDPEAYPEARLVNILAQRKARWYLDNLEDFFLLDVDIEGEEF
jgi:predicted anti-sigma-YlaC factor YlaD